MLGKETYAEEDYWKVRNGYPDAVTLEVMKQAIEENKSFYVETTGSPTWLAETILAPARDSRFEVEIHYPITPFLVDAKMV